MNNEKFDIDDRPLSEIDPEAYARIKKMSTAERIEFLEKAGFDMSDVKKDIL
jgi:hypothetical protein